RRFLRAQFENIERPLLKSGDNLWFFFAGHGLRHRDKDYLMLCDSDPGDVEHTAIAVEYVTERLRRSGADNVVLFLDACRDEGSRGGVGIGREQHQGVITFYSCTANQKSWEFDQLQHGSFTYALLEGLRIQGEANCATVERLNQHLRYYVPRLNSRYGKGIQNPYLKAEPPYKMYFILLEQSATLKDVEPLKFQASLAENESNLLLAEQLWIRILAVSRGDLDAIAAIQRIAVKKITQPKNLSRESVSSTPESTNLPRGTELETSETNIQKKVVERKRQEAERIKRSITRQQFLKWIGWGSTGLITAFLARGIFNSKQKSTLISIDELDSFNFETVTVDQKGEIVERSDKQAKFFKEDLGNDVNLEMVFIPGGQFMMGTKDEEIERLVKKFNSELFRREKPQHEVTIQPFFVGKYPITQAQYQEVMGQDPSIFPLQCTSLFSNVDIKKCGSYQLPIEQVSWEDADEFCQRLSKQTGKEYRLPTEAEWEYACRAGTTTPFNFGEMITNELANYRGSSTFAKEPKGKTTPVGSFPPNAFGLYDMHGNVWEWCQDNWHGNYEGAPDDGSVWSSGKSNLFVIRGGSWGGNSFNCRSAYRSYYGRGFRDNDIGFRVMCVVPRTT
ncbi:MAG: SUMF1/EgtB/PvdO family nonheme iron enzyme, partial [Xenococcus sp. (in: cyanobacteria)]